jgi:V8-like Glu-specific endopeptidase
VPVLSWGADDTSAPEGWYGYSHFDQDRPPRDGLGRESFEEDVFSSSDQGVLIVQSGHEPWRWLCQLIVKYTDDTRALCTGWLAGPRLVVTAGACITNGRGRWPREIEVIPGLNGAARPYSSLVSTRFETVEGWARSGDASCDYGAVFLDSPFPGTGHFGFAHLSDSWLRDQEVNSAGYPGHRALGTQWFDAFRVTQPLAGMITYGGHSDAPAVGSPLWLYVRRGERMQRLVCGVVGSRGPRQDADSAVRINDAVFEAIAAWKQKADPT